MPTLVLLAGPNGAGKTTFINGFLRERPRRFSSSILTRWRGICRPVPVVTWPPGSWCCNGWTN